MKRAELKARARKQLGNGIFTHKWMQALFASLIAGLLTGVGSIILYGPMSYGLAYVFLKQARDNNEIKISDIFEGFKSKFGKTFLIGLMTSIFAYLWLLLFIIPGFIKAYAYSMSYYVSIDHPEYNWKQCINESRRIMKGHKWEKFVLDLSFIGWLFIGSFCAGVGNMWVAPYINATGTNFYESIKDSDFVRAQ